jgi:hypothetical protein
VDGNDDFCGLQSGVEWCAKAGAKYLILVHGFSSGIGTFTLTVSDNGQHADRQRQRPGLHARSGLPGGVPVR